MPIEAIFENNDQGIRLLYTGVVTGQDSLVAIGEIYRDARFAGLKYWLGDFTGMEEFTITPDEVRMVAEESSRYVIENKELYLTMVSRKEQYYGIMRMYEIQMGMSDTQDYDLSRMAVFETVEETEAWIAERVPGIRFD